ncbi:30S ribosomal protein S11, chloroplastic [Datura stramonium]|uniref:30S ribosomal protein S11, chloroplastic n=1 Tax=Datura stramonium TaxID=4076 RepID=A0ABS8VIB3_DATST|nr:30S ribosomal protein S11, chloroplastic [Datura stramonium]
MRSDERDGEGRHRYFKSIGLGFKTPREAVRRVWGYKHRSVSFLRNPQSWRSRRRERFGSSQVFSKNLIVSMITYIMSRSTRDMKRHSNIPAHISPCFRVKEGDHVIIGQCRSRIILGTCHGAKMSRTIIVRRNYLHYVKKYQRYEKRHSNIPAHISPLATRVKRGRSCCGQCRPLSKTVRFNVLKVIPAGSAGGGKKAFTGM